MGQFLYFNITNAALTGNIDRTILICSPISSPFRTATFSCSKIHLPLFPCRRSCVNQEENAVFRNFYSKSSDGLLPLCFGSGCAPRSRGPEEEGGGGPCCVCPAFSAPTLRQARGHGRKPSNKQSSRDDISLALL